MEATAAQHSPRPSVARRDRPSLEVVRNVDDETTSVATRSDADEAAATEGLVWRAAMIGFFIGYAAVAVIVIAAGTVSGLGFGSSAGLGVFVGLFSGGGFGFMGAAVVALARQESAAHASDH